MPLKAYVGLPRAGKSYEVVVNVILPALRQGRRVVSNIAGLNYDAMCQVLYAEGVPEDKIGQLVCVDHNQVEKPDFWRTDTDAETGVESFIQPGDQVALDEIWRFWKKRGDIHPRAMNFMRMHGHMSHPETGFTCEIALITQSIRDINENIRDVVQETFQMIKNTKLGSDKSYIVHVFQRGSTSKADFIRTLPPRYYQAQYFPCYKSHSQRKDGDATAQEKNPDDRANILKGGFFKIGMPLAVVALLFGIYGVSRFFTPKQKDGAPVVAGNVPAAPGAAVPALPPVSQDWRVTGWSLNGGAVVVYLVNAAGAVRLLDNPKGLRLNAYDAEVLLPEGGRAASWVVFEKKEKGVRP